MASKKGGRTVQLQILAVVVLALAIVIVAGIASNQLAEAQFSAQPVTYQGVLKMMNQCTISYNSVDSCDNTCRNIGKTCILGEQQTAAGGPIGPIIECDSFPGGGVNLHCVCCSPP